MEWKTYINKGVKFNYPANWHTNDKNLGVKEMIVMISEDPLESTCDDKSAELIRNINLAAEIINLDEKKYAKVKAKPLKILEQYTNNKLKLLEENIEGFRLLERENTILNGYLTTKIVYTGKFLNNPLKRLQFFIVVDRDIISTVTATAMETEFDEIFSSIIQNMVDSIELVP